MIMELKNKLRIMMKIKGVYSFGEGVMFCGSSDD